MAKKVLLIGHCGPDSSYLRMVVKKASADAQIIAADDSAELTRALETNEIDLALFNRELGYGFTPDTGVETIRELRGKHPNLRMMLVSNYPDAQQAALAAGALPGFGKRDLGTPRVLELLRQGIEGAPVIPV